MNEEIFSRMSELGQCRVQRKRISQHLNQFAAMSRAEFAAASAALEEGNAAFRLDGLCELLLDLHQIYVDRIATLEEEAK